MEKKSIRKVSVLGFALLAASALTAAIVPNKAADEQSNSANNGTLRNGSGLGNGANAILSCVGNPATPNCHITASGTGAATIVVTSGGDQYTTENNTSLSITAGAVDTTSKLVLL